MGILSWGHDNWFVFLQSAGIIGGLLFTAFSLRIDARVRRIGNLIAITQHHREIWTHLYTHPKLSRILDMEVDLKHNPYTNEEEIFITLLILHLNSAFHAMKSGMFVTPEGLRKDIQLFLALPIPRHVWEKTKAIQDKD